MLYDSVIDLIGGTPLVRLSRLSPKPGVHLYAKLEGQNPTGSVKDRIALAMIQAAEAEGKLQPGDHLLEPTSGNTGISLAMLARLRGYRFTAVMPENVSPERSQLLRIFGAEIVLSPADEGSNGSIKLAEKLAGSGDYIMLFQYANPDNPGAHYSTTGPEILEDCPEIDYFVAGLGTGGTLVGVGRFLKEKKPDVKVVAVEPPAGELVQGLRSLEEGYIPPVFDPEVLDRKFLIKARESVFYTRRLTETEGIFAGLSSGAALAGALRLAEEINEGNIVVLLPEGGWKYLSTGAWTDPIDEVSERASKMVYF
ncbi:MAG: cysteine synthase B [Acidimicrobiia bacterium]